VVLVRNGSHGLSELFVPGPVIRDQRLRADFHDMVWAYNPVRKSTGIRSSPLRLLRHEGGPIRITGRP
jgi:hypothetical protein